MSYVGHVWCMFHVSFTCTCRVHVSNVHVLDALNLVATFRVSVYASHVPSVVGYEVCLPHAMCSILRQVSGIAV